MRRLGTTTPFGTTFAAVPQELEELPLDMLRSRAERAVVVEAIQNYQEGQRASYVAPETIAAQHWKKYGVEYRPFASALQSYGIVLGGRGRTLLTARPAYMPAGALPEQGPYVQSRGLPDENLTPGQLETLQAREDFAKAQAVYERRQCREQAIAQQRALAAYLEDISRAYRF